MSTNDRIEGMRARQGFVRKPDPKSPTQAAPAARTCAPAVSPDAAQTAAKPKGKKARKQQQPQNPPFRLPDGSAFSATFDGEALLWTVTFNVPGLAPMDDRSGSVHGSVYRLGQRWYKEHGRPAATAPEAGAAA